ncbi:hypothetical protein IQ235_02210 [Oscillatoriales cyanobacterium LEGE 11467]|uniref:Uncharacterized protein n=1 Tax=Zarconia navalis LEGE 11467 TaxID=1828826 RepID=A0A928Z7M6_9CYAN|nr:hypothetical protein [Zarconia navalis]MBE9039609.1 hypothetical protein [Zarconia navalis LEGE 11467]
MTGSTRVADRVEPSSTPLEIAKRGSPRPVTNEGVGISNTKMAKLCGTGKRQLRAIRDDPKRLVAFTTERLGKAYEYRGGAFYLREM